MTASRAPFVSPVRGIRAAFVFFTRLPVGGFPYEDGEFRWAAAHAPLVGLAVGAITGTVFHLLLPLGGLPAAFLALGAQMGLTGALHEDGLADTCDALGGGSDRSRVLEILKDSRVGAYGAAALVFSLGTRAALVAELGPRGPCAFALAGCAARVAPALLMAWLPYVTDRSTSKSRGVADGSAPAALVATVAVLWGLAALVTAARLGVTSPGRAAVLALATLMVAAVTGSWYRARVSGITGDFLGATEQVCEIAVLAVLAFRT